MPETIVQCDGCGAHGRRAENCAAPDFWFYLESVDRTFHKRGGIYVVWACSEACRDVMWKRGPGRGAIDDTGTFRQRERIARKASPVVAAGPVVMVAAVSRFVALQASSCVPGAFVAGFDTKLGAETAAAVLNQKPEERRGMHWTSALQVGKPWVVLDQGEHP